LDFEEEGEVFEGGAEEAKFKLKEDEGRHEGLGGGQRRHEEGKERAPKRVRMVDRLRSDAGALLTLMSPEAQVKRVIRKNQLVQVIYRFGDASGKGFGSCILIDGKVHWEGGQWVRTISQETSNYRELRNLVDALEEKVKTGVIDGSEIFMFSDKSVTERAYFRGTSSSKQLFLLVVRLRNVEMRAGCTICLVHVSGARMIASGIDGVSRGELTVSPEETTTLV
jgi:hypothetical protein